MHTLCYGSGGLVLVLAWLCSFVINRIWVFVYVYGTETKHHQKYEEANAPYCQFQALKSTDYKIFNSTDTCKGLLQKNV